MKKKMIDSFDKIIIFLLILVVFITVGVFLLHNYNPYQNDILDISNNINDVGNSNITKDSSYKWCLESSCAHFASPNYVCSKGDSIEVDVVIIDQNNHDGLESIKLSNDNIIATEKNVIAGADKAVYVYEVKCNKIGRTTILISGANEKEDAVMVEVVDQVIPVQSINIGKSRDVLRVGDSSKYAVEFNPIDATNQNVRWYTSDSRVVKVDSEGFVSALSPGLARITAIAWNDDGMYYESHIDITVISNSISPYVGFDVASYICPVGNSIKVKSRACNESIKNLMVEDSQLASVSGMTYYRNTDDGECIESTYVVNCDSVGQTNIIVDGSTNSNQVPITIVDNYIPVRSLSLGDYGFRNILVGESVNLTANIIPNNATNKKIYWSSSNNNAFIVDETGTITAVGTGKSTITATVYYDDSTYYSDSIEFNAYVSDDDLTSNDMIYFTRASGSCKQGKNAFVTLHLSYMDSEAINLVGKVNNVRSLNNGIATIEKRENQVSMCLGCTDYEIKCKKSGTAIIEATTTKGGRATYAITVK